MQINSTSPLQAINELQNSSIDKAQVINNPQKPAISTDTVTISSAALSMEENTKAIMKDYDLNKISYNALEEMGGKLRDAGIISDHEFLIELVPPSIFFADNAAKILEGSDPRFNRAEPINVIEHFEKVLELQKEFNKDDQKSIEIAQKRVDLANYLDKLHDKANIEQLTK